MPEISQNAIAATNGTGNAIELTSASNTCTANITNFPHRNLLINGAMNVAQRASSGTGTGYKSLDRWNCYANSASWAWTQSKDTDSPDGFSNSFKIDVTTAHTPGAADYFTLQQRIEAQDLQHLLNGSAGAKKVTLSFWVKSPKTGNHAVALYKPDNTTRIQTKTYSVSAANTWEKKTITYDGDTAGGGIANDNGVGLQIDFVLAVGSNYTSTDSTSWVNYSDAAWAYGHAVNVTDNTANNFYLTGVQLEVGDYATDFEHKKYADDYKECCRYYYKPTASGNGNDYTYAGDYGGSDCFVIIDYFTPMRAIPTLTANGYANASYNYASYTNKERFQLIFDTVVSGWIHGAQLEAEL